MRRAIVLGSALMVAGLTTPPQRSVDITSRFLDLSFKGMVETIDVGDSCLYRIPDLTIRFTADESRATIGIKLDTLLIRASSSGGTTILLERQYPLTAELSSGQNEFRWQDIKFTIPKDILGQTDYLALAAAGLPIWDMGRPLLAELSEEDKQRFRTRRAIWPISARGKIVTAPDQEERKGNQRASDTPAKSDDPCSPARIR